MSKSPCEEVPFRAIILLAIFFVIVPYLDLFFKELLSITKKHSVRKARLFFSKETKQFEKSVKSAVEEWIENAMIPDDITVMDIRL